MLCFLSKPVRLLFSCAFVAVGLALRSDTYLQEVFVVEPAELNPIRDVLGGAHNDVYMVLPWRKLE
jgi:hypothetical protein